MRLKVIVGLVTLSMLVGTAAATHGTWLLGSGQYEPNTRYDNANVMFQTPNKAAVDKVYLNGQVISAPGVFSYGYANLNLDGGNVFPPGGSYMFALLGFWRDCNKDGYVGLKTLPTTYGSYAQYSHAVSAAAGFPVDPAICPQGSGYWPNQANGQPSGLVDEFRHIGPCRANDPVDCDPASPIAPQNVLNDVVDNSSRVWGDWERPNKMHVPYGGLLPTPRGTFQDSDGTLRYVDDATLNTLSSQAPGVWSTKPVIGKCDQPHPVFLGGPGGTCGLWPLYQVARLGNDTTCNAEGPGFPPGCSQPDPLVTVWDTENDPDGSGNPCDNTLNQSVNVPSPTNPAGTTYWVQIPTPAPSPNPNILADGSISGQIEHTLTPTYLGAGQKAPGTCNEDQPAGLATNCGLYACEREPENSVLFHDKPSWVLNFTWGTSTNALAIAGFPGLIIETGTQSTYNPTQTGHSGTPAGWYGNVVWTPRPPRSGWGAIALTYSTMYADVSEQAMQGVSGKAATALPKGLQDQHVYGSDYCPAITTGGRNINPANKWECSRTQWDNTRRLTTPTQYDPIIGDPYDLRDVDCYDNTVSEEQAPFAKAGIVDCATDDALNPTHP